MRRNDDGGAREYRGKIKAVILDWSGTICDAFAIAPAAVLVEVFRKRGVPISMTEARGPMGLRKDLHIKALTEDPAIRARWRAATGKPPADGDAAALFADFVPRQIECLPRYAALLPGVAAAARILRRDYGIKIGVSTGFTRAMAAVLLAETRPQGFEPDAAVAGDEVAHGARPKPFMVYRNLELLDVHPIRAVVKADDTAAGVGEGLEAGCWTVGVARYSSHMDIDTIEQAAAMRAAELKRRLAESRAILRRAGAHYVADSIAELPAIAADLNRRLAAGEKP